ncbi:hypothetical protein MY10362_000055 [Beauveria mimosiformis]
MLLLLLLLLTNVPASLCGSVLQWTIWLDCVVFTAAHRIGAQQVVQGLQETSSSIQHQRKPGKEGRNETHQKLGGGERVVKPPHRLLNVKNERRATPGGRGPIFSTARVSRPVAKRQMG